MDFGVVLQTDPPASRVIELARQAELYGFSHVWTFDSHLLWEEPFVIYSRILDCTHKLKVGPMVTNPATRDWTVTASLFATLNEMYGNRTICGIGRGDSAVRVINGKPVRLAERLTGLLGVANERNNRIAAREHAADDLAADAAGGPDHCGAHRAYCELGRAAKPVSREADQVDPGQGATELLHPAALAQPAEVDDRETRVLEQPAHS